MKVRVEIDLQNGTLASAEFDVPEHIVPRRMNQYNEALSHVVGGAPLETAPVSATEIKWAETLRHHAAHPDPISIHCAIPARMVEEVASHIDALTARLSEAESEVVRLEGELVTANAFIQDAGEHRLAEAERVTEEQVERACEAVALASQTLWPFGDTAMEDRIRARMRTALTAARGGG